MATNNFQTGDIVFFSSGLWESYRVRGEFVKMDGSSAVLTLLSDSDTHKSGDTVWVTASQLYNATANKREKAAR